MKIAATPSLPLPQMPGYLPLHTAGSGFSSRLGDAIRAELAGSLKPPVTVRHDGRFAALQQSVIAQQTSPADSSYWAATARSIGAQYLPPADAGIFERQMALESCNFSPDVISGATVSSAGAQGIAQLMPSSYPNVNRLDPVASLNAAGATMRDNLARYGGDMAKALAAYNAGAGRVDAAVAARGASWQADLPAETQQYLRLILGTPAG